MRPGNALRFALALLVAGAHALASDAGTVYLGAGIGESHYDHDATRCRDDFGKLKGYAVDFPGAGLEEAVTAIDIALAGTARFNDTLALSARVGAFRASSEVTASIGDSASSSNALVGIAATAKLTPQLAARLDAEHFTKAAEGNLNIDMASLSLSFNF